MAITQAQVDALEAAMMRGELTVEHDGKRVTYRSVDDMQKAIAYGKQQLADAANGGSPTTQSYAEFSRD